MTDKAVVSRRITIVESDRHLRDALAGFLRSLGDDVTVADDADEVLRDGGGGQILLLPAGPSAERFLRELRRRHPAVVPVALAEHGSVAEAVALTRAGAFDYLVKPVVDEELRLCLEKAHQKQTLLAENLELNRQVTGDGPLPGLVSRDGHLLKLLDTAAGVADDPTPLLIVGETGTGKSALTRAIHDRGRRGSRPLIELRGGRLAQADLADAAGGTLVVTRLDDAAEADQARLNDLLGSGTLRVVAHAEADPRPFVADGRLRADLYHRLAATSLHLPPLRDRPADVPLLAERFLRRSVADGGRVVLGFTPEATATFVRHAWPGNVRELENAVAHAAAVAADPYAGVDDLPPSVKRPRDQSAGSLTLPLTPMPLKDALEPAERQIIHAALARHDWNRAAAAEELAINRATLYKKIRKYALDLEGAA